MAAGTTVQETVTAVARIIGELAATPWRRELRMSWGTLGDEGTRELPGDDVIAEPMWSYTHAIGIEAPPERVWPWIAQIGQGRGGFYSYQQLENLFGCQITNSSEVIGEFQHIAPGDEIRLHPKAPAMPVRQVVDGQALVLGGLAGPDSGSSWSFIVEPVAPGDASRLLVRGRGVYGRSLSSRLFFGPWLMEPVVFVMETKMLATIRQLAEQVPEPKRTSQ